MNQPAELVDPSAPTVADLLDDPTASKWLKAALREAVRRDPVDALNDALVLAAVLDSHLRRVLDLDGR